MFWDSALQIVVQHMECLYRENANPCSTLWIWNTEEPRSQHCVISAPADPDASKPPLDNHCYATQNQFFYVLSSWNFETYWSTK
jgi:hypothetical protein